MTEVLILSEADVAAALNARALRAALERAFVAISRDHVSVPDRTVAQTAQGMLLAMPGYVEGSLLVTKLVSLFPDNGSHGLPSHQGVLAAFDPATGAPIAVMGAEHLTQVRTAMSAAIAADRLARADSSELAIIGAGAQARGHLDAFLPLRPWTSVRIWNRTKERAVEIAENVAGVCVVSSVEEAIAGADVVALCTHTDSPLFKADSTKTGVHVSSVGIGRELPPELVARSVVAVEWSGVATTPPPAGAADLDGVDPLRLVELGAVLNDPDQGRRHEDETTIYKSVGHAAEDAAAATAVIAGARRLGLGQAFDL